MSRTTLTIPDDLRDEAKALDINISEVLRYALEAAIPAAKAARNAGDGFEAVTFTQVTPENNEEELVQFIGKHLADNYPMSWYITRKGRIVMFFNHGVDIYHEGEDFEVYENLEALRRDVTSHEDSDGEYHRVLQAAERELGQAPTPRMLNI